MNLKKESYTGFNLSGKKLGRILYGHVKNRQLIRNGGALYVQETRFYQTY
jgi:hypothetical protein